MALGAPKNNRSLRLETKNTANSDRRQNRLVRRWYQKTVKSSKKTEFKGF